MTIDELIAAARSGSTRATGRLLSLVESARRDDVLDALGATSPVRVIGLTGPPGAGKSEIEIAAIADPTIVVLNPGAGDAVQAAKAGLLEVADIVVVNKADREGADQTVRDLRAETKAPILKLIAAQGDGIAELVDAI